jgi:hypothetical protein
MFNVYLYFLRGFYMKQLTRKYRNFLQIFANLIQDEIVQQIRDPRLKKEKIIVKESDTYGYYTNIFKLKSIPGSIQLWLDLMPNIGRPVLSICYKNSDFERIKKVSNAATNSQHEEPDLSLSDMGVSEYNRSVLNKPLAKKYFGKYILESYQSKFLSVYLFDKIENGPNPSKSLKQKTVKIIEKLIRSTSSALESESIKDLDYGTYENRKIVTLHTKIERSKKLADIAKTRDGFTCQICQFNFAEIYGELGRGFAEAHHITPLSKLKSNIKTQVKDLITVCANCHRILHKMSGDPNDIKKLKYLFR